MVTGGLTESNESPTTTPTVNKDVEIGSSVLSATICPGPDFETGHSRNSSQASRISGYNSLPSHSRQGSADSGNARFSLFCLLSHIIVLL